MPDTPAPVPTAALMAMIDEALTHQRELTRALRAADAEAAGLIIPALNICLADIAAALAARDALARRVAAAWFRQCELTHDITPDDVALLAACRAAGWLPPEQETARE